MAKAAGTDLSKISIPDLQNLKRQIDKEIESRRLRERDDALKQIRAIAEKAGFQLDELVNSRRGRRRGSAPVKYRDPKNASNTWAGRGRKPRWLEEALAQGKKLEDFAV
ncbi:MAG TPA: H-NS histone family protein [Rhodothermales bacterium]